MDNRKKFSENSVKKNKIKHFYFASLYYFYYSLSFHLYNFQGKKMKG